MEHWLRGLEAVLAPRDVFSRERGRQFVAAAAMFDATGSRDVAEFVAFMERHTVRDADVAGVVRVMTIHKSKGLGFDVVIVPDLEGQRIDQRRGGLAAQRAADRSVEWVLDLPPKLFHAQDETLSAHVRAAEAEACYEALSLLYVAMTRAKRAMYLITKPTGKSESRNYPKLLTECLGDASNSIRVGRIECAGAWSAGDSRWQERVALEGAGAPGGTSRRAVAQSELLLTGFAAAHRRPMRRPSTEKAGVIRAEQLLGMFGGEAAEFGTAVHTLLAEVVGGGAEVLRALEESRRARGIPDDVFAEAMACLRAPALADVWAAPKSGRGVIWVERAFEIVLDGGWVTGVFDRVVVERDSRGDVTQVRVFDFKTDRVRDEAGVAAAVERHTGQLQLYRRVAAVLAGVDEDLVSAELVFTSLAQRAVVPR